MKKQFSRMGHVALGGLAIVCIAAGYSGGSQAAVGTLTSTSCNSRLDVTVASSTRSGNVSSSDCQVRTLVSSTGFELAANSPAGSTTPDSSAMVAAGGELYEAFVDSAREAAVLLTPNRAMMMSRSVGGDRNTVDWNMGLAVQPVSGASNAWLTGTYTLLRANRETRIVDATNQVDADLSEVFDPATLRITFDGNSGCSISSYSSWFSYSLTTDPAAAFSQPDGDDYGLHQAVYAGEGYAGSGGVHEDSVRTFTDCDYVLSSDGKLLVTYDYTDGDAVAHSVENSYFVSADLRYIVSTVDAGVDLYRGFEVGVRVKSISGTQDERNDGVIGTYLFNAPTVEMQGSTGVLSEPDNQSRNSEKVADCMSRGSAVLSANTSATTGWNTCTWDMTSTCSVRGEEGEAPAITIDHYTAQGANTATACRFQVASNGSVDFVVNLDTAEGVQSVTFSGAIADNNEGLVLRGKYVGSTMTNPSDTNPPERQIKNDLILSALVGVKYQGTLTADADLDGLNNLGEFLFSTFTVATVRSDMDTDGDSDIFWRRADTGQSQVWAMQNGVRGGLNDLGYTGTALVVQGLGDFNADGDVDVLLRNTSTGEFRTLVIQNGLQTSNLSAAYVGLALTFKAIGDADNDGDDDVYLRDETTGEFKIMYMQNHIKTGSVTSVGYLATALSFKGLGDTNGDGDMDIILRDDTTGEIKVRDIEAGLGVSTTSYGYNGTAFAFKTLLDADGDGDKDILLRNDSTGQMVAVISDNGTRLQNNNLGYNGTALSFVGIGDMDGDLADDILLRNNSTGENVRVLLSGGLSAGNLSLGYVGAAYNLVGRGDFDRDGDDDFLFRNSSIGANVRVAMDGGAKSAQSLLDYNNTNLIPYIEK